MKRLCILVFYDPAGAVYDYLCYYIESLLEVCDRFIFIANGCLTSESRSRIEKYTQEIMIRENSALDFGAYSDAFLHYLTLEECLQYDEVILSNDTMFGPFVPFTQIFGVMRKRKCDYWGVKMTALDVASYIMSSFLVVKNNALSATYDFFTERRKMLEERDKDYIIGKCEMGLSVYLRGNGFRLASYMPLVEESIYDLPDVVINKYHFPFMKKRIFRPEDIDRQRCVCALEYIYNDFDYPVEYILQYVERTYGFRLSAAEMKQIRNQDRYVADRSKSKEKDIRTFFENHKEVYLYGAGMLAKYIFALYGEKKTKGFIVSRRQGETELYGIPIYELYEIPENAAILVAMNKTNTDQVRNILCQRKDVFYLR